MNGKFLCSHCGTEQLVKDIILDDKYCLCPNCKAICCEDYCKLEIVAGRWNLFEGPIPDDDCDVDDDCFKEALARYHRFCDERREDYERTKKEYGLV